MKMIFTWKEVIVRNGLTTIARYPASCKVRHELNGKRRLHYPKDVILTYPDSGDREPYMPRQYPSGIFLVTGIEWTKDPKYAPVKIRTNALREVFIWDLDKNGGYDKPTEKIQIDTQYHIHYTDYKTTHGCIRGGSNRNEMASLARMIEPVFESGDPVYLEVL